MKHNLKDTTFLIPLRIDHQDRLDNAHIVLNYLTQNFDTNIIVYEDGLKSHWKEFKVKDDKNITYFFVYNSNNLFHRMKMLNDMLSLAKTKVVANYDIDCLLDIDVYIKVQKMIIEDGYDFLNPFVNFDLKQKNGVIYVDINKKHKMIDSQFKKSPSEIYKNDIFKTNIAGCGFIVFLNRLSYLSLGGENTDFYAYGPEDKERFYRFYKLGFKINNFKNDADRHNFEPYTLKTDNLENKVYHLEHYRTENSNGNNSFYKFNLTNYNYILKLNSEKLLKKYINYSKFDLNNYNKISKNNFSDIVVAFRDYLNNKNKYNIFPKKRNIITMTRIGENGRLGNQMFQYVTLLVLSIKYNMKIKLPIIKSKDKYKNFRLDELFDLNFELIIDTNNFKKFKEKQFHYDKDYDNILKDKIEIKNMSFDWKYYLDFNSDLKSGVITDEKSALKHWNNYGKKEKRLYNKYQYLDIPKINSFYSIKKNIKKPFKCKLCQLSYRKQRSIENHIRFNHKDCKFEKTKIKEIDPLIFNKVDLDINGYFQSLKYFKGFERFIRRTFKFKNSILDFCNNYMKKYKNYKTIGIHVRRGDHVYKENEKNYIPPHYTITPKVFENLIDFF